MVKAKEKGTERETLVKIRGLVKKFGPKGRLALDQVEADIRSGEVTGLVGPDGAGKTTLIRILAALLEPSGGFLDTTR
jgi:drug efflux transport system ATP-binding protein